MAQITKGRSGERRAGGQPRCHPATRAGTDSVMPTDQRPLSGVRVVELAVVIAGPAASVMLGDWGADVIKVEPLDGDPHRSHTTPSYFELDNRGKRSIAVDVKTPRGRQIMLQLLEQADVFVTNLRPSALRRLELDYDSLAPKLPGWSTPRSAVTAECRRSSGLRHRRLLVAIRARQRADGTRARRPRSRGRDSATTRPASLPPPASPRRSTPASAPVRARWCRPHCCAPGSTRSAPT